ncbi:MAG: tetratricopeptide repeat protein [Chitinophagaceae bacterium]|nr:tetratricopeptide repeat protein [Chitinophagaceae bacterium]
MTVRYLLLDAFLLLTCSSLSAQNKQSDSLYRVLAHTPVDTHTVKAMISLAEQYAWTIPDSGLYYAKEAIRLNQEVKGRPKLSAAAWNSVGYASYMKAKYAQALEAFRQYYAFSKKAGDKVHMAFALNNEGNIQIELADYSKALDLYKQALELRQSVKDSSGIAMSFNNIGFVYKDIGDYENALSNFFYALREYEKLKDEKAVAKTHNFIAIVFGKKNDLEKAIEHLEEAIRIQNATGDDNELAISRQTLGSIYIKQNKLDEALREIREAIRIYEKPGDKRQLAMVNQDYAEIHMLRNQSDSALIYFKEADRQNVAIGNKRNRVAPLLGMAEAQTSLKMFAAARISLDSAYSILQLTDRKDDLRKYYEIAARYHAATGNHQRAYYFQQQLTNIKDTLLNEQNVKAMADMSVKYQTEKKEQAILLQRAELRQKNLLIWGVAGAFVLVCALGLSYYRRYRLKQQTRLQQEILKQQELATRAVIKAEEDERQRIARDLHDGVGQMMSAAKMNLSAFESNAVHASPDQALSLEKIIGLVDESCKEIRNVSHNMMPNALLKKQSCQRGA